MSIICLLKHELFTEQVNKVALSANDDKRIIQPDKINTLAHGYRTGWHGKPTREQTGETWQSDRGGDRVRKVGLRQRQGKLERPHKTRDLEKQRSNTEKYTTLFWISSSSCSEAFGNTPRYLTWSKNCTHTPLRKTFDGEGCLYFWGQKQHQLFCYNWRRFPVQQHRDHKHIRKKLESTNTWTHIYYQEILDDSQPYFPRCIPNV